MIFFSGSVPERIEVIFIYYKIKKRSFVSTAAFEISQKFSGGFLYSLSPPPPLLPRGQNISCRVNEFSNPVSDGRMRPIQKICHHFLHKSFEIFVSKEDLESRHSRSVCSRGIFQFLNPSINQAQTPLFFFFF